jgi:hypothetical protein
MTSPVELELDGTMISDTGLRILKDCLALRRLSVGGTRVKVDGVRRIASENPSSSVINDATKK